MTPLRRHTLVWLSQPPQPELLDTRAAVEAWHTAGHPFIVCRRRESGGLLSLGFCLPTPGHRPRRIACQSHPVNILKSSRPPRLVDVTAATGKHFSELSTAALQAKIDLRVFGSWMWQTLTGEPHVGRTSDLDILLDVSGREEADRAVAFLQSASVKYPSRIDGELAFPSGDVSWHEYASPAPQVLLKSLETIRLVPREEL